MVVVLVLIKRLNSIKMACKPFGLHQPIRTCHIGLLLKFIVKSIHPNSRAIIQSSGRSRHLSTITLKDSHLFKIVESIISFCLKEKF